MSFVSKATRISRLLKSKAARDAYVLENIKRMVPFQIRTMREEREWSQGRAGEAIGKPQNVVSRLESPAYGKLSLQTLLDIAHGFDVGLLIKFVPFSRLVKEYEDLSASALSAKSVSDPVEVAKLNAWASDTAVALPVTIILGDKLQAKYMTASVERKDNRLARVLIGQRPDPTLTMDGRNTEPKAA